MQYITTLVERHGLLIVFLNVLLARGGLPLPVIPTLMAAAALAHQSFSQIIDIVLVGVGGTLIADFAQYCCSRRYGLRFLGLLCRVSLSPDFCVRQTEMAFARIGPWSLLVAKFIPGLSLISDSRSHWRAYCLTCRCERGVSVKHREGFGGGLRVALRRSRKPIAQGCPRRVAHLRR